MEEATFRKGTPARCNRNCDGTYPLPKEIVGLRENSNAYRLQGFCTLGCGHMDCHWIFLSDIAKERDEALLNVVRGILEDENPDVVAEYMEASDELLREYEPVDMLAAAVLTIREEA